MPRAAELLSDLAKGAVVELPPNADGSRECSAPLLSARNGGRGGLCVSAATARGMTRITAASFAERALSCAIDVYTAEPYLVGMKPLPLFPLLCVIGSRKRWALSLLVVRDGAIVVRTPRTLPISLRSGGSAAATLCRRAEATMFTTAAINGGALHATRFSVDVGDGPIEVQLVKALVVQDIEARMLKALLTAGGAPFLG